MKLQNWILSLALLCSLATPAIAQDYSGDDQQQQNQEVDPDFAAWCANGVRTLQRAQTVAQRQIANGQFSAAAGTLLGALQNGVARPAWNIKPITWRLMIHGQRLGSTMINAVGGDQRGVKATVNALESVYDLILNSAQEIDRSYYRTRCGYCRARGVQAFDQRVLRMAGDLLDLVNDNMTYERGGQVFPVGPARAYLVGAQVVASGAAQEISQLVFAESLGCQIADLDDVNQDLLAFNRRQSSQPEKIQMFYDTYERLGDVISTLQAGNGCGY